MTRHHYRMCGLGIASAIALPELCADGLGAPGKPADVDFALGQRLPAMRTGGPVLSKILDDGTPWLTAHAAEGGYRLRFEAGAEFFVDRSGRLVRGVARRRLARGTLRHLFLDQVMPLVLTLRGFEALHASAVVVDGAVCAFMGESGTGKSTTAGALALLGYGVFADDCLALRPRGARVWAQPGYPGLRLWQDSVRCLFEDVDIGTPMTRNAGKRRVPAPGAAPRALPLRVIYVLDRGWGRRARFEQLTAREALIAMVRSAFRVDLTDRGRVRRQFDALDRIARRVPVRRLRLGDDLEGVASLPAAILSDLARAGQP